MGISSRLGTHMESKWIKRGNFPYSLGLVITSGNIFAISFMYVVDGGF